MKYLKNKKTKKQKNKKNRFKQDRNPEPQTLKR